MDMDSEVKVPLPESVKTEKKAGRKQVKAPVDSKKAARKRGPPRPHKKLDQGVLEMRISKLQRRIDRASGQLQDAHRHIDGYHREIAFRRTEPPVEARA
jgi:hypothetical protein